MPETDAVQRLQQAQKEIMNAQVEVALRQGRLNELRPKRQALEDECKEKIGCIVRELPDYLKKKEFELERLVSELEVAIAEARNA